MGKVRAGGFWAAGEGGSAAGESVRRGLEKLLSMVLYNNKGSMIPW